MVDLHAPWNDELVWLFLWFAALLIGFGCVALFRAWISAERWWPMPGRALMGWWLLSKGTMGIFAALTFGDPLGISAAPSVKTWVIWLLASNLIGSWVFVRWYRWGLVEMPTMPDPRREPLL